VVVPSFLFAGYSRTGTQAQADDAEQHPGIEVRWPG